MQGARTGVVWLAKAMYGCKPFILPLTDGERLLEVGHRVWPNFLASSVILSAAKNLADATEKSRFFAALRMTK